MLWIIWSLPVSRFMWLIVLMFNKECIYGDDPQFMKRVHNGLRPPTWNNYRAILTLLKDSPWHLQSTVINVMSLTSIYLRLLVQHSQYAYFKESFYYNVFHHESLHNKSFASWFPPFLLDVPFVLPVLGKLHAHSLHIEENFICQSAVKVMLDYLLLYFQLHNNSKSKKRLVQDTFWQMVFGYDIDRYYSCTYRSEKQM